ncbi:DUF2335 domain-containing protein [Lysinibacillus irui]|uniref:DUF2335 domain-containing protein n=1 Tax=Lysinibacillus irui TaxID=2998077 RepID=UPI0040447627
MERPIQEELKEESQPPSGAAESTSEEVEDTSSELIEKHPEVERILEKLDPQDKDVLMTSMRQEMYSGPLPHPDHLKGYAECYPDAPKEIFEMVKKQMDHRHDMDSKRTELQKDNLNKHYFNLNLGLICGFILAFTFLISGVVLILMDKGGYGLFVISTVIVSLVGFFVIGKRHKDDETENNDSNESQEPE